MWMKSSIPILYSFRRCPYAMRARLAIAQTGIAVELREVVLRNKPPQLLDISPKGTVPVLLLANGEVLEESLDIINWALSQQNQNNELSNHVEDDIKQLIEQNDSEFKYYLDRYKYADRYPDQTELYYRQKAEVFLKDLELRLSKHDFLCSNGESVADMAIFPFIRQFANVNIDWFQSSPYQRLNCWLNQHLESALFISIMHKYPAWQAESEALIFRVF